MNRVLLLWGLFVAISAHADTNVYINDDTSGCTRGETRCGANGYIQQCSLAPRWSSAANAYVEQGQWNPTLNRCAGAAAACECTTGYKKCGPDGKIMMCVSFADRNFWKTLNESCK
jgi:hypothetical protein